jgi:hypothetical protein
VAQHGWLTKDILDLLLNLNSTMSIVWCLEVVKQDQVGLRNRVNESLCTIRREEKRRTTD